ncbi:geraniol 8-hydroxylase-like isoform X1 [Asparagus officinalis]|uniref:geraniol 8-hydroxylase-like isoform X1 n=2 Tax=Asparagus officinalis TaxID=4686 RepID=UPI00098E61ED|nr:geraniol 8-hydroxylase-like isoform X1 [Asparagus officinalis]
MATFILCLTLIAFTFAIIFYLLNPKSKTNLPPGPKPLPIVGNLFILGDKPHRSLAQLAKSYGPIISLKLGQVTTIVVSSPDLAREVLVKKDQSFCSRSIPDAVRIVGHYDGSPVWLPANQKWKNLRIICRSQLFTSQRLDSNIALRHKKVRELVEYLRERGEAKEAVDIGRVVFTAVMNSLTNTLFSIDMVDPRSDSAQEFRDLVWGIMEVVGSANVSDFFPLVRELDLQGKRRRTEGYFRKLHRIFDELIDRKLKEIELGNETDKDFLDALLNGQNKLDRYDIKPLLVVTTSNFPSTCDLKDVFVAGTDTSSSTVEWAMAELLRNPDIMAKARAELLESFDKETELDELDILSLPYLQAIVKETLRLHPPGPFLLPRQNETNTELFGYSIPKHSRILVNVWAIGRHESVWKDPDIFMPERFLESDVDYKGRDFELIPFGAGRRICPGLPLALRIVHLMLASLLFYFKWELVDGMRAEDVDLREKFGVTLALANPVQAIPVPDE